MDCDCPLCNYCITINHVGLKFQNVSDVVETQERQLEEVLGHGHSFFLNCKYYSLFPQLDHKKKTIDKTQKELSTMCSVQRAGNYRKRETMEREKMTEKS